MGQPKVIKRREATQISPQKAVGLGPNPLPCHNIRPIKPNTNKAIKRGLSDTSEHKHNEQRKQMSKL